MIEAESFDADRFPRRNLSRMLRGGRTLFLLARREGEAAGYAAMTLRRGSAVARLYSFAVRPGARGQGVATALIEAVTAEAAAAGRDRVRLEVRASNAAARALYEGRHFHLRGERVAYYEDGETALIYERAVRGTSKESAS